MSRNRFSLFLVTLFTLIIATTAVAQPKKPPVKEYTIEQFMNTVRIGGSSFSSDEKSLLFHNNKSGIFNVYSVPVSGGAATQLTNSTKESTFSVSYFSTNERDARFFDIFEMPIDTFKSTLVYKDETGLDVGAISDDEKYIAFQKN